MKLAEALILRSDLQTRLEKMRGRLMRAAKVQEGDTPPENPKELLAELDQLVAQLMQMVQQINKTNSCTVVCNGHTLADLLAKRDVLMIKRKALNCLVETAGTINGRYSQSEIRIVSTVNVAELQKQADELAGEIRETDTLIQQHNWLTELL